ncbi:hypothetical protein FOA52_006031 [Chlamydomonas sp. UWO 241]|nr:hypothetical protein FOA52_006031 [Chlamydomonas sp. UWO 241]
MDAATGNNAWVESYLEALLSFGLSHEHVTLELLHPISFSPWGCLRRRLRRSERLRRRLIRAMEWDASGAASGVVNVAGKPVKSTTAGEKVNADTHVAQKYYVQQVMQQSEESLRDVWAKAAVGHGGGLDRDARLQHVSWRAWSMKRRRAEVAQARARAASGDLAVEDEYAADLALSASLAGAERKMPKVQSEAVGRVAEDVEAEAEEEEKEPTEEDDVDAEDADSLPTGMPIPGFHISGLRLPGVQLPGASLEASSMLRDAATASAIFEGVRVDTAVAPELSTSGTVDPILVNQFPRLYIILVSLHGLIRGEKMELGRDPDTGGQVKYVVELAKALGRIPSVCRVDLLTRSVADPSIDPSYSVAQEKLDSGAETVGDGAFIVRLPCGPKHAYLRKEELWAHTREFSDRAIEHAAWMLARLQQESSTPVKLFAVHGHYADAGEVAAMMSHTLGVDMVLTGHSLGRNKLEHLTKSRTMTASEVETTYRISRRIEGEERALDAALVVFTSTRQEVLDQWGLYDGYGEQLSAALTLRPVPGYHVPRMAVVPPGLDFSNLKVSIPEDPWEALLGGASRMLTNTMSLPASPRLAGATAANTDSALSQHLCNMAADEAVADAAASPPTGPSGPSFPSAPHSSAPALSGMGDVASSPGRPLLGTSYASPTKLTVPRSSPRRSTPGSHGNSSAMLSVLEDSAVDGCSPEALAAALAGGAQQPPIWREVFRFLRNPHKPAILAMCRPDAKKNVATLLKAYGSSKVLRELANLVLILGNRDIIGAMAPGSQTVMNTILRLIDEYDLYGHVAYPKHHTQADISDIYLLITATKGVFVNIALQEPFGLTLIEAAAHGAPIVATTNGGPVDIINTLHNGSLVDPNDQAGVTQAIIDIIIDTKKWDKLSGSGRTNIVAYSWPSHCAKCLRTIKDEMERQGTMPGGAKVRTLGTGPGPTHNFTLSLEDLSTLLVDEDLQVVPGSEGGEGEAAHVVASRAVSMQDMSGMRAHADPDLLLDDTVLPLPGFVPLPVKSSKVLRRKRVIAMAVEVPDDLAALPAVLSALGLFKGDSSQAAPAGGLDPSALRASLLGDSPFEAGEVGLGLMCPWPVAEAKQLLQNIAGVDALQLDFLVCDAGAMLWHVAADADSESGAELTCDEEYEKHIDFRWDSQKVRQVLTRITRNDDGWGKLAVMLAPGSMSKSARLAAPQKGKAQSGVSLRLLPGASPVHFNIQVTLSAPGSPDVHPTFRADQLLSVFKRKLRRCGIRTQMLLTPGRPAASASPSQVSSGRKSSRDLGALPALSGSFSFSSASGSFATASGGLPSLGSGSGSISAALGGFAAPPGSLLTTFGSGSGSFSAASGGRGPMAAAAARLGSPQNAPGATLHVTPQRASRSLALRFLAHRNKLPLEQFVVVAFSSTATPAAGVVAVGVEKGVKEAAATMTRPLYFAASDTEDLLGGLPRCVVLPGLTAARQEGAPGVVPTPSTPPPPAAAAHVASGVERAAVWFAIDGAPYEEDQVVVLMPDTAPAPSPFSQPPAQPPAEPPAEPPAQA